ncbi:O-antigen translocase [Shewanella algae]|uniref:O-antigen translocase n=1 Tax=Shewanella algae TaxID=38313 RepID=UPI001AACF5B3|nr:O-antigen translocase [Shewanella algae]MBO2551827.1 O-antigen translocase [Shewanella algae]
MKRLLKVSAMTGLLTLLRMAMGFVVAKVVAIYTGPTGLAMLGQVQSLVGSLNGVVNAPASSGVVRFTAENNQHGFDACTPWWRAATQWVLIIAAIVIPIGILLAEPIAYSLFKDARLAWVVVVTVSVVPFVAIGTLCNSVINGQQLYRRYVGLGMLSVLFSGSVMLTMIVLHNIEGALFATAVQAALIGVVMLIANLRQPWFKLRYWWGAVEPKARKQIGSYMLMAITSALTVPLSLILVRNILIDQVGWDATGQWQAVYKISEVYLGVITVALGTYYLPRLSSLIGLDSIMTEINKTARVIIPIVATMALGVYLFRDVAISLLFTEDFRSARDIFAIQLSGDVIKIASWLYAYPMLSRGATKWYIGTEVFFSLTLVLLTYFFVLDYGVQGASISYLVNYIFYFIFILVNFSKFTK